MLDLGSLTNGWAGVSLLVGATAGVFLGLGAGSVLGWMSGYAAGVFRVWRG